MQRLGLLVSVVETVLLTVIVYLLVQGFVAQPFRIEQRSMQGTLQDGQYVLVDKLTPQFDTYSRGDIIVFRPSPDSDDRTDRAFIKRVIGEPGDEVAIRDGQVWVNGARLDEAAYVYQGQPTDAVGGAGARWLVPEGSLFVLGDHRARSTDSRTSRIGMVPLASVIGRAVLRYWPLSALEVLTTPTYASVPTAAQVSRGADAGR